MNTPCPHCGDSLVKVWQHGNIEMGHCPNCGQVPLAIMQYSTPNEIAVETEFEVTAIHDDSNDFYLRLSRLVADFNVVQLKQMKIVVDGRRVIPLGVQTNSISVPMFMARVKELGLTVELRPANHGDGSP